MQAGAATFTPDELTETAPGVYYTRHALVPANAGIIAFLKEAAARAPLRRARLCAHPSPESPQHDMLIVTRAESYVAPHRHPRKSEAFLVLEGQCEALLFDEDGTVTDVVPMADMASGRPFFYRMPEMSYHALDVQSDCLVFFESAKGPFDPSQTESAPWAPAPDQTEAGKRFIAAARRGFKGG